MSQLWDRGHTLTQTVIVRGAAQPLPPSVPPLIWASPFALALLSGDGICCSHPLLYSGLWVWMQTWLSLQPCSLTCFSREPAVVLLPSLPKPRLESASLHVGFIHLELCDTWGGAVFPWIIHVDHNENWGPSQMLNNCSSPLPSQLLTHNLGIKKINLFCCHNCCPLPVAEKVSHFFNEFSPVAHLRHCDSLRPKCLWYLKAGIVPSWHQQRSKPDAPS